MMCIKQTMIGIFVFSVVGLWTAVLPVGGSEEGTVELYVTDALTFPSKPVQLQARLTKHLPEGEQGLAKEPVEFSLQGHVLGTATTDIEGWARLEFAPKMRGNLSLSAKWATTAKADVVKASSMLTVSSILMLMPTMFTGLMICGPSLCGLATRSRFMLRAVCSIEFRGCSAISSAKPMFRGTDRACKLTKSPDHLSCSARR